jgi:hypothetical protein
MTGNPLDPEEVIRTWLADSVPNRAPSLLKETLEDATSELAGNAQPWSRARVGRFRVAGQIAAAVAIIAIVASGVYLYGNGRATPPGQGTGSPSGPPTAMTSATSTSGASPSTSITTLQPKVTRLPGSNWRLVTGAFPRMASPSWAQFQPTVFALTGRSGGFVAFVPSTEGMASHRAGGAVLAAFKTAGPTSPTSWVTRVYQSTDGVNWSEQAPLPGDAASVGAVAESGGQIVAVGWTGDMPNETAMAWTTSDLLTWHAAKMPVPPQSDTYSDVFGVAAGPAGFLAYGGAGASSEFWISPTGLSWTVLATSGLPAEPPTEALYGLPDGWMISGSLWDRSATWQSNFDGSVWKQTWTGPGMSGMEGYNLGPIFKAPGGGFLSFGRVGMAPGGPSALPYDMLIWTSSDELSWIKSDRVKSPGWIAGFATGPGGYVAAGVQAPGDMGTLPWGSIGIWTSQDGRSWKAAAGLPSLDSIEVIAVVGDGAHVVVTCVDELGNLQLLVGDDAAKP